MARTPRKIHELRITKKLRGAYVAYRGEQHYLGPWDTENDEPTPQTLERFEQLKAHWRSDSGGLIPPRENGLLLVELWAKWLTSEERPRTSEDVVKRTQRYLFGRVGENGPHNLTLADDFDGRMLINWQSHLCGMRSGTRQRLARDTIRRCVKMPDHRGGVRVPWGVRRFQFHTLRGRPA